MLQQISALVATFARRRPAVTRTAPVQLLAAPCREWVPLDVDPLALPAVLPRRDIWGDAK